MRKLSRSKNLWLTLLLTFVLVLGSSSLVFASVLRGEAYTREYGSLEEALAAGRQVAEEIAAEGMVLLKNENGALPLSSSNLNISVFGDISQNSFYNGSGSGGNSGIDPVSIQEALQDAGFNLNPALVSLYGYEGATANVKTGSSNANNSEPVEIPVNAVNYSEAVTSTYADYSDLAIIVIGRGGGEGGDLKRANVPGHSDVTEHNLELNDDEKALLQHVKDSGQFETIIYLINTAATFELAGLQDDPAIDAILWTGMPGGYGFSAMPKILLGEIAPSGRTSAIYPANLKQDPSWFNFGNQNQIQGVDLAAAEDREPTALDYGNSYDGTEYAFLYGSPLLQTADPLNPNSGFTNADGLSYVSTVNYTEGIYMGYRWYETAATIDGYFADANTDVSELELPWNVSSVMPEGETDAYYNRYNGVLYPFGYGLSYTTFSYSVGTASPAINSALAANTEVSIPVTVTNTGDVASKQTVQLYSNPPYEEGGIEKAAANLITFVKTDLIQPGQSETVTLTFNARDLADFDWNDANDNGFQGYELEAGTYELNIALNSHEAIQTVEYTVASDLQYDGSTDALNYNFGFGETATALFSQDDRYNSNSEQWQEGFDGEVGDIYVSRADWALPVSASQEQRTLTDLAFEYIFDDATYSSGSLDEATDPWYISAEDIPATWTQAADNTEAVTLLLADMIGVDFDDAEWETFMNQLTWEELVTIVSNGGRRTTALPRVGNPGTHDDDGPTQTNSGYTSWPSEPVQAATFNVELGEKLGNIVGEEASWSGRVGWYGPGANTNRSPFGGRNFEYYSQDGVLAGIFGAAVVKGATDKGIIVYAKHMFGNDQEAYRYGGQGGAKTFVNEQAIRQIYMRPWEYMSKYGNLNGAMNSFASVGLIHAAANYKLNQEMMRDEFGYESHMVTDMYSGNASSRWGSGSSASMHVRNGVIPLSSYSDAVGRYVDGVWNDTEQMVQVNPMTVENWVRTNNSALNNSTIYNATATFDENTTEDSPSQWYWTRMTAQRIMFTVANSRAMLENSTFNVIFDMNGGEGARVYLDAANYVDYAALDVNEEPTLLDANLIPADPTRFGYIFAGWSTDPEATVAEDVIVPYDRDVESLYFAVWDNDPSVPKFTLDYNMAGMDAMVTPVVSGEAYADPGALANTGTHAFVGWFDENEVAYDFATAVTQDIVVHAVWERVAYAVSFDLLFAGSDSGTQYVPINDVASVVVPSTSRTGYNFIGWYTSSNFSATSAYNLSTTPIDGDITLYGRYELRQYTITFDVNAELPVYSLIVNHFDSVPASFVPVREGYIFDGWYYMGGSWWNPSAVDIDLTEPITASRTVMARWIEDPNYGSFTVMFDANGGSAVDSQMVGVNGMLIEPKSPERSGYTFEGWFTDAALTSAADFSAGINADATYYAKWEAIPAPVTYTVTFNANSGSAVSSQTVGAAGMLVEPKSPVRAGYSFEGWFTDAALTSAADFSAAVNADATFYAKWEAIPAEVSYVVTFNSNEGSAVPSQTLSEDGVLVEPKSPEREGYTFDGWYTDADLTSAASFGSAVSANTTLYAKWVAVETGCGSAIAISSLSVLGIVGLLGVAAILLKKRY